MTEPNKKNCYSCAFISCDALTDPCKSCRHVSDGNRSNWTSVDTEEIDPRISAKPEKESTSYVREFDAESRLRISLSTRSGKYRSQDFDLAKQRFQHVYAKAKKVGIFLTLDDAIDTLIYHMIENHTNAIVVDLHERERSYLPAKEMTIGDIEKALGHKVKIIKEHDK